MPEGDYRARLRDADAGNILFEVARGGVTMQGTKRFFLRFGIEVHDAASAMLFQHIYDARDRCA